MPTSSELAQIDHICDAHISTASGGMSSDRSFGAERRSSFEYVLQAGPLRRAQSIEMTTFGSNPAALLLTLSTHVIHLSTLAEVNLSLALGTVGDRF